VSEQPHYRRLVTRERLAAAAVPLVLALGLSACGGSSTTTASTGSDAGSGASSAPPASGNPSATGGPPVSPSSAASPTGDFLEITRSGGIAGVRDIVRVASDGTAKLVTRDGRAKTCRPAADDVRRLRQLDLAAMDALPSGAPVADGFVFSVRTTHGAAAVGDGDKRGRRAEVLDAAATVVATCLAGTPAAGGGVR
jgi:hypothetical protein